MTRPIVIRKFLLFGLGVLGLLIFITSMASYQWLRDSGPRNANVQAGQVYATRMQQPFDVYLTHRQKEWIDYGPFIGVALLFAVGFLNLRWKVFSNPHENVPKKLY
jgi:hypothetical protein